MACSLFLALAIALIAGGVRAQDQGVDGPVYIVQPGDTLSDIAFQFGVSVDEIVSANNLTNPNQLRVDDRLVIPGLQGVRGVLFTREVALGENLRSLSRRYRVPLDQLKRLNRIVSPAELYVGSPVILPMGESQPPERDRAMLGEGETLIELAVRNGTNPWILTGLNDLSLPALTLPGEVLYSPQVTRSGPGALPPGVWDIQVKPLPLVQGETGVIVVVADSELSISGQLQMEDLRSGRLIERELHFFSTGNNESVAMQGIHAMAQPGLYSLFIEFQLGDGMVYAFTQKLPIASGGYINDLPLSVPKETLDPEVTGPEDEIWNSLTLEASASRRWDGQLLSPSPFGDCWTSLFGSRRSYNGSPYNYFHTGLDFCGGVGIEIRAPAPGMVVYAAPMVVRGKATMIDHGWGVYTGYMHQSEILVSAGDQVEAGQLIGLVGGTGRVTGAHLHWEVWVGGIQVNPLTWLERVFP